MLLLPGSIELQIRWGAEDNLLKIFLIYQENIYCLTETVLMMGHNI